MRLFVAIETAGYTNTEPRAEHAAIRASGARDYWNTMRLYPKNRSAFDRRRDGFSLIELMVTCVIIGTLALLLVPSLQTAREKARNAACVANLKAVSTALSMYTGDEPSFLPGNLPELANGDYLPVGSTAPRCPKDSEPYVYYQLPLVWLSIGQSVNAEDANAVHLGFKNQLMNDGRVQRGQ